MKYISLMITLIYFINNITLATPPLSGDVNPTICIENNQFLLFYRNNENGIFKLKVFSKKGSLKNDSEIDSALWENFYSFKRIKKQTSINRDNIYCLVHPDTIAIIPKINLKEISGQKFDAKVKKAKNVFKINTKLDKSHKTELLTDILINNEKLLLIGFPKNSPTLFFYSFNLKDLRFIEVYKIGNPDRYFSWTATTKVLAYASGYVILWKEDTLKLKNKEYNPNQQTPIYLTYLNLTDKKVMNYKILKGTSLPIQLSANIIDGNLLFAYMQTNKKEISKIKTKFVNLKELLKQKPVSITGPVREHRVPVDNKD